MSMAMIAITTNSSMSVKPAGHRTRGTVGALEGERNIGLPPGERILPCTVWEWRRQAVSGRRGCEKRMHRGVSDASVVGFELLLGVCRVLTLTNRGPRRSGRRGLAVPTSAPLVALRCDCGKC